MALQISKVDFFHKPMMQDIRRLAGLTLILLAVAQPAAQRLRTDPGAATTAVFVDRAAKYVAEYHTKFPFLVADEEYVQTLLNDIGQEQQQRVLKGELFLTYLEFDHEWIAVHDFATQGGQPVPGRGDLRATLLKSPKASVLREIARQNARFNIGTIERHVNEPTLPMLVLEPKRIGNFKFSHRTLKREGGTELSALDFEEEGLPTIANSNGRYPIYSHGEIVIESLTGRIRRTRMKFEIAEVAAELNTTYALERTLDLWVPSLFEERYQRTGHVKPEVVRCEAKLTNYRKFGATVRIR